MRQWWQQRCRRCQAATAAAATTAALLLLPSCHHCHCRCTAAMLPNALLLPLIPCCRQAAAATAANPATAGMLPLKEEKMPQSYRSFRNVRIPINVLIVTYICANSYCTFDINLLLGPWKSRILRSSKQDYYRSGKNKSLSQLWHFLMLKTSQDVFHCRSRLLNKKHHY
jgi:hypothetical protein